MKKGEIYEGKVTEVNFPNKGKVECENGTVTVKNVIPGQNIRFMINKKEAANTKADCWRCLKNHPLSPLRTSALISVSAAVVHISRYLMRTSLQSKKARLKNSLTMSVPIMSFRYYRQSCNNSLQK